MDSRDGSFQKLDVVSQNPEKPRGAAEGRGAEQQSVEPKQRTGLCLEHVRQPEPQEPGPPVPTELAWGARQLGREDAEPRRQV